MPVITPTKKPTALFTNHDTFFMETSTELKPHSTTASPSYSNSTRRVRFLLLRTGTQLWLADNLLIDDKSELYTVNPEQALQFMTVEAASERARHLLHLFPDLTVNPVEVPVTHG